MELICATQDIPDRGARGFSTPDGDIFIVHRDGGFYAYQNVCPHLDVNLEYVEDEFLDRDREHIICSNHGALFTIENGACIWGPCEGQSLTAVPIVIQDQQIYLTPSS